MDFSYINNMHRIKAFIMIFSMLKKIKKEYENSDKESDDRYYYIEEVNKIIDYAVQRWKIY